MTRIVILTGAGISAESGLGTFRDAGGLWAEYDLNDVATPEGFARNPGLVHDFYNARRANCLAADPNVAHEALARLQREHDGDVVLITQNIDDLHERAGSPAVLHMHGEVMRARCAACGAGWRAPAVMRATAPCPTCGSAGPRPDVVWFGEIPYRMDEIAAHLATADLFAAIGTSGQVYPAAGFVAEARARGARTIELTLDPSDVTSAFDAHVHGPATRTVPDWVASLLET